ncbi:hypothetical protein EJ08DRAFT_200942 [Tothia fuscella]|uniref:Uncharacterized protein n=1 Tax=Tothia fuscella TaxID=1048955 RepID=A0A9P4TZQ5_9PEZI|nr:hypothetical protein EJ08DRAFT_200942 [Tothia fuscella]
MSYMWTSSLCATTAIVGVSAVGYALGRPEQRLPDPSLSAQKRKQSSEPFAAGELSVMASRLASSSPITPLGISSLPPSMNSNATSSYSTGGRVSYDGRINSGKVRRLTTSDAPAQRRTDHQRWSPIADHAAGGIASEFGPRLTLRSRPSWVKRLSVMSTSQNSSREPSPQPESPSLSQSNGSASFSNSGSAVPFLGPHPNTALGPNKLVKRPSTTRLASGSSTLSRSLSIRRPATSHQRSSQRSSFLLENASSPTGPLRDPGSPSAEPRPRKSTHNDTSWKQYFSVRRSKSSAWLTKGNSQPEDKGIKRVLPNDNHFPTLITAKSVVTSHLDVDDFPDFDDDSVFFGSRPPSAFGLESMSPPADRLSQSAELPRLVETPLPPDSNNNNSNNDKEDPPRRSLSLHDLLSRGPSKNLSARKAPPARLAKKAGRRVVSAPVASSNALDSSLGPRAKRRDMTDPSVFEKGILESMDSQQGATDPPRRTEPQHPNPAFGFVSHSPPQTSQSNEYSPLLSQPPYLGSLKLDQISHSPILPHGPVRPSNYSTAPSEQTSTCVVSETDARGMHSADEEDGEFGSDSAFDSLRTRGARSPTSARNTRIETIFDNSPPFRSNGTTLQDIIPSGMLASSALRKSQDIIEEEESNFGTPHRAVTVRSDRADDGSPAAQRVKARPPPLPINLPSSPPDMAKPLSLGTLEYDDPVMEDDEENWTTIEQVATPLSLRRTNPHLVPASTSFECATPQQLSFDPPRVWHTNRRTEDPSEQSSVTWIDGWT